MRVAGIAARPEATIVALESEAQVPDHPVLMVSRDATTWQDVTPAGLQAMNDARVVALSSLDDAAVLVVATCCTGEIPITRVVVWVSTDGWSWHRRDDRLLMLQGRSIVLAHAAPHRLVLFAASPQDFAGPPWLIVGRDQATVWTSTEHEELRSTHAYALTATDDVVAIGGCAGDPSRAFVWLADGPDDAALTSIPLDGTGQACVGALAIVPDAVIAGGSDDETATIWTVDPTGEGVTREDLPVQGGAADAWINGLAAFDGGMIAAGSMHQGGLLRGREESAIWMQSPAPQRP